MSHDPPFSFLERWETIVSDCGITLHKENIVPAIGPNGGILPDCYNGTLHFRNKHGYEFTGLFGERKGNTNTTAQWLALGFPSKELQPAIRQLCCHHHLLPKETDDPLLLTPPPSEGAD